VPRLIDPHLRRDLQVLVFFLAERKFAWVLRPDLTPLFNPIASPRERPLLAAL
jgi:hypothetical protein